MTYRALELLNLPQDEPAFLLDIGCGSGLSGEILDEAGYLWAGVDIAPSMLGESVWPSLPLFRYFLNGGFNLGCQRLRLNGRSKAIYSYRTSDRALAFDPEASTAPSGACERARLVTSSSHPDPLEK